jgi:hypothetical protein
MAEAAKVRVAQLTFELFIDRLPITKNLLRAHAAKRAQAQHSLSVTKLRHLGRIAEDDFVQIGQIRPERDGYSLSRR